MATNDLYRLTYVQQYSTDGPIIHNVLYYLQTLPSSTPGTDGAALLGPAMDSAWSTVQAIQSAQVQLLETRCENIIPSADNFSQGHAPGTVVGARTGECLPPFVCYAFRKNRVSSAVRNGQIRIAGVSEGDQANGVVAGGMTAALNAVATLFQTTISFGGGQTALFQPRIFRAGRPAGPGGVPPAVIQADFEIQSVVYTRISTQNTRKFGRGI